MFKNNENIVIKITVEESDCYSYEDTSSGCITVNALDKIKIGLHFYVIAMRRILVTAVKTAIKVFEKVKAAFFLPQLAVCNYGRLRL